jgi:hypothetical protein
VPDDELDGHLVVESQGAGELHSHRYSWGDSERLVNDSERGMEGSLGGFGEAECRRPVVNARGVGVDPFDAPLQGDAGVPGARFGGV